MAFVKVRRVSTTLKVKERDMWVSVDKIISICLVPDRKSISTLRLEGDNVLTIVGSPADFLLRLHLKGGHGCSH